MRVYELIQDNGMQNKGYNKIGVTIDQDTLHYEILKYFKWRKNKEDALYNIRRFKELGTAEHDKFIKHLDSIGY